MIKLYHASPCPYGRKVLAVLSQKALDYEIKKMSFAAKDHQKPPFLGLNPNGEIPLIDDEGVIVYESSAIAEYLDDEYPEPPLMPADSESRARVRMVHQFCDLHFVPAAGRVFKKILISKETPSAEDRAALQEAVDRLAVYLGDNKHLAGKSFTLADCAAMPYLASVAEAAEPPADLEKLKAYLDRVKKLPAYKGAAYELNTVW